MSSLKLYYDLLSQPSRSLYILLKASKIPFEACPVPLRKGVHYSEDFKNNISKFQRVPVLHDGDFKLNESIAIIRYLSNKNLLDDKWYPKNDLKKQAKVDEYLEWQHLNIRAHCAMYFRVKWMTPLITGEPVSEKKVEAYENRMIECLDQFEELFLTSGPYITGDRITAADVFAATEIEQPRCCGFDTTKDRPKIGTWLQRVRNEIGPVYQEANVVLEKMAAKSKL